MADGTEASEGLPITSGELRAFLAKAYIRPLQPWQEEFALTALNHRGPVGDRWAYRGEPPAEPQGGFLVPPGLWAEMPGVLGKLMRGEIKPVPHEPEWHRCFACWIVAKLTRHTRCRHGWLESGCWECSE